MIKWLYYPRSRPPSVGARLVVDAFKAAAGAIDSSRHNLRSDDALAKLAPFLSAAGFAVEQGKTAEKKITVPVLFGINGKIEKSFDADAYHEKFGMVVEVEAGRGVVNNQFLKDLFQACMMVDVKELAIAVRNDYQGSNNFDQVVRFFDTLYASNRLKLPLEGILIIGY
jgi:hypothetical protein